VLIKAAAPSAITAGSQSAGDVSSFIDFFIKSICLFFSAYCKVPLQLNKPSRKISEDYITTEVAEPHFKIKSEQAAEIH